MTDKFKLSSLTLKVLENIAASHGSAWFNHDNGDGPSGVVAAGFSLIPSKHGHVFYTLPEEEKSFRTTYIHDLRNFLSVLKTYTSSGDWWLKFEERKIKVKNSNSEFMWLVSPMELGGSVKVARGMGVNVRENTNIDFILKRSIIKQLKTMYGTLLHNTLSFHTVKSSNNNINVIMMLSDSTSASSNNYRIDGGVTENYYEGDIKIDSSSFIVMPEFDYRVTGVDKKLIMDAIYPAENGEETLKSVGLTYSIPCASSPKI